MKNFSLMIVVMIFCMWQNIHSNERDACYYFKGELKCLSRVSGSVFVKSRDSLPVVSNEDGSIFAVTGEIGVVFKPETSKEDRNTIIEKYGLEVARTLDGIDGYFVFSMKKEGDPFDIAVEIFESGLVKWAQPVWLEEPQFNSVPDDLYYTDQWHHPVINSEKAWSYAKGYPAAKIAVIDSGVDVNHPDLRLAWGHSFVPTEQYVEPNMGSFQNQYIMAHGTCVSGIAAGLGFNGWGIAGVCADCTVIPVKYIGLEQNYPPLDRKLQAIKWAVDEGAWVINNSWVVSPDKDKQTDSCIEVPADNFLLEAVDYAVEHGRGGLGTIIVWSAGNSTCDTMLNNSLQDDRTVTVSGLDTDLTLVYYSNYGNAVDIAAPAGDSMPEKSGIVTTDVSVPNKGFNPAYNNANSDYNDFQDQLYTRYFDGTSAAAPVVSGALALMLSVRPGMSLQEAIECMKNAASEPQADCQHGEKATCFGAGILDVGKMVEMAYNGECGGDSPLFCSGDEDCMENEMCDLENGQCIEIEKEEYPDNEDDSSGQSESPDTDPSDDSSVDTGNEEENEDAKKEDGTNMDNGDVSNDKMISSNEDEVPGCSVLHIR